MPCGRGQHHWHAGALHLEHVLTGDLNHPVVMPPPLCYAALNCEPPPNLSTYSHKFGKAGWHACEQAALGAGMRCIITYTSSTKPESFDGAERIFGDIPDDINLETLRERPEGGGVPDDRR